MGYFKCLGSMITNDARCIHEIKSTIPMANETFNKMKTLLTSRLDLNLRKKLVNCYVWSRALYGAETWTLRESRSEIPGKVEMCLRRMHKISLTDHVRYEEVLPRVEEDKNTLQTIKTKVNWSGHILHRNCCLKHLIEGKIERRKKVTGWWETRCKQLLDDLKEKTGYWKLKEEALDRTPWRTRFGRGYGPVIMQTTEWMNEWMNVIIFPQYSTLTDDGFLQKPRHVTTNYTAKYQQT